jgi:hypothetical protein
MLTKLGCTELHVVDVVRASEQDLAEELFELLDILEQDLNILRNLVPRQRELGSVSNLRDAGLKVWLVPRGSCGAAVRPPVKS